jgi:hypothetical protein
MDFSGLFARYTALYYFTLYRAGPRCFSRAALKRFKPRCIAFFDPLEYWNIWPR